MKVAMECSQYGPDMSRNAGDVIDVKREEAERLIDGGLAHEATKSEIALAKAKEDVAADAAAVIEDRAKKEAHYKAKEEAEAKAKEEAVGSKKQRREKSEHAVDEPRETAVSQ